jgi:hypothetical protein
MKSLLLAGVAVDFCHEKTLIPLFFLILGTIVLVLYLQQNSFIKLQTMDLF